MNTFASGRGNTGGENMLRHHSSRAGRRAPKCSKRYPAWLPIHPIAKPAGRRIESKGVGGHGIRLHHELRVLVLRLAPTANLDVHFAGRAVFVPGEQRKNRRRLQVRDVLDNESVGPESETSRQFYLRAHPALALLPYTQVQITVCIRKSALQSGILPARTWIAWRGTQLPLEAAELQEERRLFGGRSFHYCQSAHGAAFFRQGGHRDGCTITSVHQQSGVLRSWMRPGAPGRVRLDRG